tara:strand:- start:333 stop:1175 length:843 start_codon:yes stop_codon:yes gene_type:complete
MSEIANSRFISSASEVKIHHLAVVDSKAEIDQGVVIGPGSVIGPEVKIGTKTIIGPNVVLDGRLTIGANNKIFPGACLGLEPQDLKYQGASTEIIIGDNNTIRECVTINRATEEGEDTRIGDSNLIMAYCHLGHNCQLGNAIIMSNGIQVAGHVVIEDKAVIGGCLGIHQFVHIGGLAMIGGMTRVDRDVPPYSLAEGHPGRLRGLNKVGLKRSGFNTKNSEEFRQLQEIWRLIFRSNHLLTKALQLSRDKNLLPASEHLCRFMEASVEKGRRGPMPFIN